MAKKYKYTLVLLLLAALCLIPALSFGQTDTPEDAVETHTYRGNIVQFSGNITISADEIIRGNVVAMSGNIDVEGKVYGNITAIAGTIRLYSGSLVTGNVTAIAGAIEREDGALIGGKINTHQKTDRGAPGTATITVTGMIFTTIALWNDSQGGCSLCSGCLL